MCTSQRVMLSVGLIMICSLFFAYWQHSTASINSLPTYFQTMEEGHKYEKKSDYERAINLYGQALRQTDGVNSDVRLKSKIAVHNRIASCYRSMGQMAKAATEFRISVALGDTKYAPRALAKIR